MTSPAASGTSRRQDPRRHTIVVRFYGEPPTYLTYEGLEALGVRHAFTTRHHGSFGGISARGGPFASGVDGPALQALGVARTAVRFARQIHGTTCLMADDMPPGLVGTGDAIISTTPKTPLAIFTADCLAVVLVDAQRRILAVAHAGWRGTIGGLLGQLVRVLSTRFGARPDRLHAVIGPSIGPCCYEVDEPVIGPLQRAFPAAWVRWAHRRSEGKWWLDLWQANTDQLTAAGLRSETIINARLCTGCRGDLFFSYRKEGAGRQLATLALMDG